MRIIFWSMLLIVVFNSCQNAEPATYYLPKNFEGVFAVVYSQNQGSGEMIKGRHQFYIPENCILLTKAKFSDGWRDDMFLMPLGKGYDTLKMYMPNKYTTGKKFDAAYYKNYTDDSNQIAVNFRQIVNSTFFFFDDVTSFSYVLLCLSRR